LCRDLNIGDYIRVPALLIAGVYRGAGVAIGRIIHHVGVDVQSTGIEHGVDLAESSASIHVNGAIDVVAGDIG
jgi:hypothetical protein